MNHRPDTRGLLYFGIAVLGVWSGEIANLGGAELFARIEDRWPALAISSVLARSRQRGERTKGAERGIGSAYFCARIKLPNISPP